MKRILIAAIAISFIPYLVSCDRDSMAELNTNPDLLTNPTPEWQLGPIINSIMKSSRNDMIQTYEVYGRWFQYVSTKTNLSGLYYKATWKTGDGGGAPSTPYGKFYGSGRDLENLLESINVKTAEEQAERQYLAAVAKVLKVYLAWRASDVAGDIPYREALRLRYGGSMTPKYDSQAELYKLFDETLKEQSTILSSSLENQINVSNGDFLLGYITASSGAISTISNANVWAQRWARFANTLRFKIALRYYKRDAAHFTNVLNDVMPKGIISNSSEEAVYISNNDYTNANEDDINRLQLLHVAARSFVSFMVENDDPRLRTLLLPNMYGPSELQTSFAYGGGGGWQIESLKDSLEVLYNAGEIEKPTKLNQYYVGYPSNPNALETTHPDYHRNYINGYTDYEMGNATVRFDTISRLETSLWFKAGMQGDPNPWRAVVPIISYAEVCFMMAEVAEKGMGNVGKSAQQWYEDGVKASMEFYLKAANLSGMRKLEDRKAMLMDNAAIESYLEKPMVAYAGTKEEKLEKISLQAWVHYYRQPDEAWSYWRRTDLPKFGESTIFALEKCVDDVGIELFIPRRAALPRPTATGLGDNTPNWKAALENMDKISNGEYFDDGKGNIDEHVVPSGRVYWDTK